MKKIDFFRPWCFSAVLVLSAASVRAGERDSLLTQDWKFYRGCVSDAENPAFPDSTWRTVELPHDWSVEPLKVQRKGVSVGPFSKMSPGDIDTGQTMGGEGWYRKRLTLTGEDRGKRIFLYIEAAYNQSEVYVNGRKVHYNAYGYTPYKVDITPWLNAPGKENTLAVKVVNEGRNSRWYAGSGLFRHVWLIKTDALHLDAWDTYVDASRVKGRTAEVRLSTVLHNAGSEAGEATVGVTVYGPDGRRILHTEGKAATADSTLYNTTVSVPRAQLWSPDSPCLYTAEVTLTADGRERDKITVPFGIRTIAFTADKGFLLNGKPLKLKGCCVHHDNGLLGAAAIRRADERKAELLKANGFNAVRLSHNLASEDFLNACDRLGLLVIHETFDQWQDAKREEDYHRFFDRWSGYDLSQGIRRDRNHPSIILWSLGNEIAERADARGEDIVRRLSATVRKYDTSRFTTAAVNSFWDRRQYTWEKDSHRAFRNIDVAGYNYMWQKYETDHAAYPDRVMYGSESYPKEMAQNWNLVEKHPYIIGDFVWTGMDYLGEAGLGHALQLAEGERDTQFMGWPWYNAWCGDIDLIGEKKPQSYYRDVLWRRLPVAMAVHVPVAEGKREVVNGWGWPDELQSWNWQGCEGRPMQVNVYSRAPKVKLYLNGRLIGEQPTDGKTYTTTFTVPYSPGKLTATAGVHTSFSLETTGRPAAIRLKADRTTLKTNVEDLSYVTIEVVDDKGRVVPDAIVPLKITCSGAGRVIASGNGAYADMESFRSPSPHTFRGRAQAIVSPTTAGTVTLTVSTDGLQPAAATLTCTR